MPRLIFVLVIVRLSFTIFEQTTINSACQRAPRLLLGIFNDERIYAWASLYACEPQCLPVNIHWLQGGMSSMDSSTPKVESPFARALLVSLAFPLSSSILKATMLNSTDMYRQAPWQAQQSTSPSTPSTLLRPASNPPLASTNPAVSAVSTLVSAPQSLALPLVPLSSS